MSIAQSLCRDFTDDYTALSPIRRELQFRVDPAHPTKCAKAKNIIQTTGEGGPCRDKQSEA